MGYPPATLVSRVVKGEFAALQLKHFEQIDYQPISEVRFLQGDAAKHAAIVFDL